MLKLSLEIITYGVRASCRKPEAAVSEPQIFIYDRPRKRLCDAKLRQNQEKRRTPSVVIASVEADVLRLSVAITEISSFLVCMTLKRNLWHLPEVPAEGMVAGDVVVLLELRDDEGAGQLRMSCENYACFSYCASFCLAVLGVRVFSDIR
jgi:hypothetical protein